MGNTQPRIPPATEEIAKIMADSEEKQQEANLKQIESMLHVMDNELQGMLIKEISAIVQEQIKMCVELVKLETSRTELRKQQLDAGKTLMATDKDLGTKLIKDAMDVKVMGIPEIMTKFGEIMGVDSKNMKLIQDAVQQKVGPSTSPKALPHSSS